MKTEVNNGGYRIMAEINMIPFIDVALVLLIIFMVMTPFLIRAQIKVNFPDASGKVDAVDDRESVIVQVDRNGTIFMDGKPVPPADISASLRRHIKDPKKQPLQIEADRDTAFQHVVVVLDAGKQVGVAKMGVCVKPAKPGR